MNALVAFDLVGPSAHFRCFYTNSSSLSYGIPPRTVLAGILAALRGWERDSYYDALTLEQAWIGVAVRAPIRRVAQTVNYVRTKSLSEVDGSAGPTQVPVEFLLPAAGHRHLRYRVFFTHTEAEWVEDIYEVAAKGIYRFPLYLGITECPAWIENAMRYGPEAWRLHEPSSDAHAIITALPIQQLQAGGLELTPGLRIYKERLPLDFTTARTLRGVADVLWEAQGNPIPARLAGRLFEIQEGTGVFLE